MGISTSTIRILLGILATFGPTFGCFFGVMAMAEKTMGLELRK